MTKRRINVTIDPELLDVFQTKVRKRLRSLFIETMIEEALADETLFQKIKERMIKK